ncbi:Septin-4 [Melipona quadrifasciata]|uniref:Septin-4 n=2 Tax=Meliponini TaxID=83319 RepID=A0A0M8ZS36_9HYME|nr:Septin-4 [Melipona quadrifasciata]
MSMELDKPFYNDDRWTKLPPKIPGESSLPEIFLVLLKNDGLCQLCYRASPVSVYCKILREECVKLTQETNEDQNKPCYQAPLFSPLTSSRRRNESLIQHKCVLLAHTTTSVSMPKKMIEIKGEAVSFNVELVCIKDKADYQHCFVSDAGVPAELAAASLASNLIPQISKEQRFSPHNGNDKEYRKMEMRNFRGKYRYVSNAAPSGQKVSLVEPAKFSNGFRRIGRCCATRELVGTRRRYVEYDVDVFYVTLVFQKGARVSLVEKQQGKLGNIVVPDYIGFATLPEQVHRKSVKRGFEFTLMVLGESGLGKSTLINSLFLGDLYKDRRILDAAERIEKTTTIEKKTMDIEERGVRLRLTIVDTPGFGDAVNCEDTWKACSAYIDEQFRQYFTDESGLNRKNIQDNRVHCCLYFIPPYGHGYIQASISMVLNLFEAEGHKIAKAINLTITMSIHVVLHMQLRQIDLEVLKRLHRKVNVVPVIAKADTLTTYEVKMLKDRILADIEEHEIQIYQFPDCDSDEDEEFKQQDKELKACIPFAVVGSSTVLEVAGKKVRGRQYPWGVVEVENPKHSDFVKLRTMLISTHMQDLKDVTQDVHYENFRAQCISQISQQAIRERSKLKRDSGPHFENSISDTDRLLLQKDEEIRRMQDMLAQMQEKLKATGQVGPGIGLRGRVGSLGNDLDSTDVEKKRNSIIDV